MTDGLFESEIDCVARAAVESERGVYVATAGSVEGGVCASRSVVR